MIFFGIDFGAWLDQILRWWHVFSAILWIGQTYLFNRLEKNLRRKAEGNVIGDLWMVHGGGYFYLEKQKYPETAHNDALWFKWASGSTWLSGILLLAWTYYHGGIMVDPEAPGQFGMSAETVAMIAGIGGIILGWVVYDLAVRSPLGRNDLVFGAVGFVAILGLTWLLPKFMSPRAAFLHVAAILGTIMTANVFMRILPTMRKIIEARKVGKEVDERLLAIAPQRSKHNSFIVAPIILVMISNHYAHISFGADRPYISMAVYLVLGWSFAKFVKG